jgi:biopolymer transport protein TolR
MAEINVTPMVDVMLVLLIIFMVTAPLMMAGVQVDLPESKAEAVQQEQEPVAISIDAAGALFIGDEPIGQAQLPARLQQIRAASSEEGGPRIMFRADRGLDYGIVMRVMGEINRAGLRRIALVSVASGGG